MLKILTCLICISSSLGGLYGALEEKITPVAAILRQRQPHWRPKIISYYPNGSPDTIIFYEQIAKDVQAPVKQVKFYPEGQILNEMDLIVVPEDSLGYKEWKADIVPHGLSVSLYPNGAVEKVFHYDRGILHGEVKLFYDNGKVRAEGTFKQGQRHGLLISYNPEGIKEEQAFYSNGTLEDELIRYYPKGARATLIPYKNGLPHGNAMEWYESGSLKASAVYSSGVLHSDTRNPALILYSEDKTILEVRDYKQGEPAGSHIKYHPNGKEQYKIYYQNGKKQGLEQYFGTDGRLIGECAYQDGVGVGKHWIRHENGTLAYVAEYDSKGTLLSPIQEYYPNGNQKSEVILKDTERDGPYREWYENGQLKVDYIYTRGQFDGEQKEYFENGNVKLRASYKDKLKDGLYQEWLESGQPVSLITLKGGVKQGLSRTWHPNGQIQLEEQYEEGAISDIRKEWYENGALKFVGRYEKGLKEGLFEEWNEQGEKTLELRYKNDLPDGLVQLWHGKNRLKQKVFYVMGKKEGKEEEYYSNGQIKALASYKEGKLDGTVSTWYEGGSPWLVKRYLMGVPTGQHTEYFPSETGSKNEVCKVFKEFNYNDKGLLEGDQKTYFPSGGLQSLIAYSDGEMNGLKALWDSEGVLLEEATYEYSRLHGRFFQKMQDGKELVYHYKDNLKEGLHQIFYPAPEGVDKVIAWQQMYINDLAEGEAIECNPNGQKVSITPYVKGLKEGLAQVFHPKGQVLISLEFHGDKKNGAFIQYFPSGKVHKQSQFLDDLQEGSEKTFFESGALSGNIDYRKGKIDGVYQKWNEQGVLVFDAEYKEGLRHGKMHKYYDDGKPHLIQTFVNDELHGIKKSYGVSGEITETRFDNGNKAR